VGVPIRRVAGESGTRTGHWLRAGDMSEPGDAGVVAGLWVVLSWGAAATGAADTNPRLPPAATSPSAASATSVDRRDRRACKIFTIILLRVRRSVCRQPQHIKYAYRRADAL
jgi:hypothetical protein